LLTYHFSFFLCYRCCCQWYFVPCRLCRAWKLYRHHMLTALLSGLLYSSSPCTGNMVVSLCSLLPCHIYVKLPQMRYTGRRSKNGRSSSTIYVSISLMRPTEL
jgi:hypothetical protein